MEIGTLLRINNMKDEPQYNGRTGYVTNIDDAGHIHGTWGGCSLLPDVDDYEEVKEVIVSIIASETGSVNVFVPVNADEEEIKEAAIEAELNGNAVFLFEKHTILKYRGNN